MAVVPQLRSYQCQKLSLCVLDGLQHKWESQKRINVVISLFHGKNCKHRPQRTYHSAQFEARTSRTEFDIILQFRQSLLAKDKTDHIIGEVDMDAMNYRQRASHRAVEYAQTVWTNDLRWVPSMTNTV